MQTPAVQEFQQNLAFLLTQLHQVISCHRFLCWMPYLLHISCWHYVGNFPNWMGRKGWCVHKGEEFFFPCGISHFLEQFEGGKWYLYPFCQMSLVATRARIKYLSIKFFLKFLSTSWLATHSETWENWLSSTAILNQQFLT